MAGTSRRRRVGLRAVCIVCAVLASQPLAASARLATVPGEALEGAVSLDFSIQVPPLLTLRFVGWHDEEARFVRPPAGAHLSVTSSERIAVDGFEVRGNAGTLLVARGLEAPRDPADLLPAQISPRRLLIAAMP